MSEEEASTDGGMAPDARLILTLVGYALRAVRRHKLLIVLIVLFATAGALVAYAILPRQYTVHSRLLTSTSYLLPALVSSTRLPYAANNPMRGAIELVKSRESLGRIVDEAQLVKRWEANRSLTGKATDAVRELASGKMTDADIRGALIRMIDNRLQVFNEGDVLVFRATWFTPAEAVSIVEAAQQRFLTERRGNELAEVRETVRILEEKVDQAGILVDKKTVEVTELMAQKAKSAGGATVTRTISVRRPARVANDPESKAILVEQRKFQDELRAVRNLIKQLERNHRAALGDARAKLNDLKRSLGPQHPDVLASVRLLRDAEVPPPTLQRARFQESDLTAKIDANERSLRKLAGGGGETNVRKIEVPVETRDSTYDPKNDPEIERVIRQLRTRISRYEDLVERQEEATTQMQVSESAFEFRYKITVPALKPTKPDRPRLVPILGGGIFVGLFLAFVMAILADLRHRTIVEPWFVEVIVGVPVLGEVALDERYESTPEVMGAPKGGSGGA